MYQISKYKTQNNKLHRENMDTKLMDLGYKEHFMNFIPKANEVKATINELKDFYVCI